MLPTNRGDSLKVYCGWRLCSQRLVLSFVIGVFFPLAFAPSPSAAYHGCCLEIETSDDYETMVCIHKAGPCEHPEGHCYYVETCHHTECDAVACYNIFDIAPCVIGSPPQSLELLSCSGHRMCGRDCTWGWRPPREGEPICDDDPPDSVACETDCVGLALGDDLYEFKCQSDTVPQNCCPN